MNTSRNIYHITTRSELNQLEQSLMSFSSADEFGHSCRICRWNRPNLIIQECPCECIGTVGFVHLRCLRRWILRRRSDKCEVCGATFAIAPRKWSYKKLFWSFFKTKYVGTILKNSIQIISLAPISYLIVYQLSRVIDDLGILKINDSTLDFQTLTMAPILLVTTSIVFFCILEFAITRCLIIKNTVKVWWMFGGLESD